MSNATLADPIRPLHAGDRRIIPLTDRLTADLPSSTDPTADLDAADQRILSTNLSFFQCLLDHRSGFLDSEAGDTFFWSLTLPQRRTTDDLDQGIAGLSGSDVCSISGKLTMDENVWRRLIEVKPKHKGTLVDIQLHRFPHGVCSLIAGKPQ